MTGRQHQWRRIAVHPHMSGDNGFWQVGLLCRRGSPPHEWGQSGVIESEAITVRFTPT